MLLAAMTGLRAQQGDPKLIMQLDGLSGQIAADSAVIVSDPKFHDAAFRPKRTTYTVKNRISLRINEAANLVLPAKFFAEVVVAVGDTTNGVFHSVNKTFRINYQLDSIYTYSANYVFEGANWVSAKIVSLQSNAPSSVWQSFYLENELQAFPLYDLDCNTDVVAAVNLESLSQATTADEITASWPLLAGAHAYDLEWTYIDADAMASGMYGTLSAPLTEKIFDNNGSRITTAATSYRIPLLYDGHGYLFVRARAVQNLPDGSRRESGWGTALGKFEYDGHENQLNWQATTSFAEEGKRKAVVQYFDGSLRSRQTVTKDNTTQRTIVAESIYDFQGRPVIQVLPAPTLSSVIGYTKAFNQGINSAGNSYDKQDFDRLTDPATYCAATPDAMATASGAARYYSPENPEKNTGINKFIPDAQGYPYTQVEYLPDQTGRVSAQSGVGPTFKLNGGHDTKYYYGTPGQEELNALFGTEVGLKEHYFKTMVRDANGIFSVSYTDMAGKTIATALAGQAPGGAALDTLASSSKRVITESLADRSAAVIKDMVMESQKGLLVSTEGTYSFHYSLNPELLQIDNCQDVPVCYDCLYDLEIVITDDCNNQTFGGLPHIERRSNFTLTSLDTACNTVVGFDVAFDLNLVPGSYQVTKRLMVSKAALAYYRDTVFVRNNQCRNLESFIQEQREVLAAMSDCAPTCEACTLSLGTWANFWNTFKEKSGIEAAEADNYLVAAQKAYADAQASCAQLCTTVNELDEKRRSMLLDMTPSSGQYARLDDIRNDLNIFYSQLDAESGPVVDPRFSTVSTYKDGEGYPAMVFDEGAGIMVPPQQLNPQSFSGNFQLSWAEALLPLHPEFKKLEQYALLKASIEWDQRVLKVQTYAEALAKGYLNPISLMGSDYTRFNGSSPDRDPITSIDVAYAGPITQSLLEFRKFLSPEVNLNLWSMATIMVKCAATNQGVSCYSSYKDISTSFNPADMCAADLDMAWRYFRQMYLEEKRTHINNRLTTICTTTLTPAQIRDLGYESHFENSEDLLAVYSSDLATTTTAAQAKINENLRSNCQAHAQSWLDALKDCQIPSYDKDALLAQLVDVCAANADLSHQFGVGSAPGNLFSNTFEGVLEAYFASRGIQATGSCNPYLIRTPAKAVSQTPDPRIIVTKPEPCECENVNRYKGAYDANAEGYGSFSSYLFGKHHERIADSTLSRLLALCNGAGGSDCTFPGFGIPLPELFECNTAEHCTSCTVFKTLDSVFTIKYPDVKPVESFKATTLAAESDNKLYTDYFNAKLGFNKDIDSYLGFKRQCGLLKDSICTRLTDITREYKRYQGIPELDAMGVDTAHWTINYGGTFRYVAKVPLGHVIGNGVLKLPAYFADTVKLKPWINYDYLDTLCNLDTVGFDWETRMIVPDASVISNIFETSSWIWVYGDNAGFMASISKVDGKGVALCNRAFSAPDKYCFDADVPGVHMNDWTTIRFSIRGRHLDYYVNGVWKAEVTLARPFTQLHGWSIHPTSTQAIIDYIKVKDLNGKFLYNEEFDDPYHLARIDGSKVCNCEQRFRQYYNAYQGTNYTYSQIDSIYQANACGPLAVCDTSTLPVDTTWKDPGFFLCEQHNNKRTAYSEDTINNCSDNPSIAFRKGVVLYEHYRDSLNNDFDAAYRAKCLQAYKLEEFTVTHFVREYHYTLYYYDQAGNLVKTVPPEGVHPRYAVSFSDSVNQARSLGTMYTPAHTLVTQYRYNTLNQVVAQLTPDAGISQFWYDRLGRLAISQNARQKAASGTETNRLYSYTGYDVLGRITEVGEIKNPGTTPVTDALTRNVAGLAGWLTTAASGKSQITTTVYDQAYTGFTAGEEPLVQHNLRNRVSYTSIAEGANPAQFNAATFYSYDIHGNVDTLVQDYGSSTTGDANIMNGNNNRWKKLTYQFDLVSGKVNKVSYNPGKIDQFFHRYEYDAENRITEVFTSTDGWQWERDAAYSYYLHGPLARTQLGDQLVQGLDYAYTLQGWIKGVNSTTVRNGLYDMGSDGATGAQAQFVGRDVLGYSLNYFEGDYTSISNTVVPFPAFSTGLPTGEYRPLYNGNISSMAVNIASFNAPRLNNYRYDQLNRITGMDVYAGLNSMTNQWGTLASSGEYKERVAYDGNGNILRYLRQGSSDKLSMDSLTYKYHRDENGLLTNNRLNHVRDNVNAAEYAEDIDAQSADNYQYDAIGNLVKDNQAGIDNVEWNVYGKIRRIVKSGGMEITYSYDASGNRISKAVKGSSNTVSYTWYVRDATGNVMSTYSSSGTTASMPPQLTQSDVHLYGSSRLGVLNLYRDVKLPYSGPAQFSNERGRKLFEISNHLGNVLATVSDKKMQHSTDGTHSDYFEAELVTASDYYPFGMLMPGRQFGQGINIPGSTSSGNSNVNGYSVPTDLTVSSRSGAQPTEYVASGSVEFTGEFVAADSDDFTAYIVDGTYAGTGNLGSGLSGSGGLYRYGFNGKEMDNEISGSGNKYDYGFRIYNPRIGKFLSVDPLTQSFPWYTPFQFAGNKPVIAIDLDGLEEIVVSNYYNSKNMLEETVITTLTDTKTGKLVNMKLKKDNGNFIARQNILVRNVRYDGSTTYSHQTSLTESQVNIVTKAKKILIDPKNSSWSVSFGSEDGDGGESSESLRKNYNTKFKLNSQSSKDVRIEPVTKEAEELPKKEISSPPVLKEVSSNIEFWPSTASVKGSVSEEISSIFDYVSKSSTYEIVIFGNAGGTPSDNFKSQAPWLARLNGHKTLGDLALHRAAEIKRKLVDAGLDPKKIQIKLGDPQVGWNVDYKIKTVK
ncbi:hypothetical protein FPE01S_03_04790 [Flavihumibacter petaseus NBRC 106054]|uniref:Rhs family protein n=2 Tax=Flavihumibacter TaxID=1004301 RepID=A0A0E9N3A7_9BACT|nr:hypothetical protein FPE01S_03_04790 [Flavihumibacter petaseus NBRC 106054]